MNMPQPLERILRKKCHYAVLKKDKHYKRFESIQMNETTGVVIIRWIDREGNTQTLEKTFGAL